MKLSIDIRELRPDDAAAYRSLRLEAARDPGFGASPETEAAYSTALLAQTLAPGGHDYVLGAFDGPGLIAMVGFGAAFSNRDHTAGKGTLYGLYTSPGWRRTGIARALCTALIDREVARTISLRVAEDNRAAIELYASLGFSPRPPEAGEITMIRLPTSTDARGA